MATYTDIIEKLIKELKRLPGIGPRSAERIVFHLLKDSKDAVTRLSELLVTTKETVFFCTQCNNIAESELCHICRDDKRDRDIICVVEEPKDIIALEKSRTYTGLYHVLLGALSPLNGIGPKELKITELEARVKNETPREIIIATNPNTEGETTALYLTKILSPYGIPLTRLARGVPMGSSLEYIDEATLACAIERREVIVNAYSTT